jgi:hypothetical protein
MCDDVFNMIHSTQLGHEHRLGTTRLEYEVGINVGSRGKYVGPIRHCYQGLKQGILASESVSK